jgi:hypothetical protein
MLMGKPKYLGKKTCPSATLSFGLGWNLSPHGERSATIHTMAQAKYGIHRKCVCVCSTSSDLSHLLRCFQVFKIVIQCPHKASQLVLEGITGKWH